MIKKISKKNKDLFNKDNIDVSRILISKKEPFAKKSSSKYFFGHGGNYDIRPLCTKLSQIIE